MPKDVSIFIHKGEEKNSFPNHVFSCYFPSDLCKLIKLSQDGVCGTTDEREDRDNYLRQKEQPTSISVSYSLNP